jgi:hypothetical protein
MRFFYSVGIASDALRSFSVRSARTPPRNGILLIERLFDHVFDRWVGDGDVVDGEIRKKS